jgi:site-specific DNA-cytosine methylase
MFDSGLVSAQRRPRYYWTNLSITKTLGDSNLVIRDVVLPDAPQRYYLGKELNAVYDLIPDGGNWRDLPDNNPAKQKIIEARIRSVAAGRTLGGQSSFFRKYGMHEKCPCLTASGIRQTMTRIVWKDPQTGQHRYPTAEECEILQNFPVGYTHLGSDSLKNDLKRYELLGNSFTVGIIAFILSHIP